MLSGQIIDDFTRDGAVLLRGVLKPLEVQLLAQGIEHNLAHLSPLAIVASQPDDPGRFVEDFCTWQDNPAYRAILLESALPLVAAQLMQSREVRLYHDHLLVKEAGTRQPTPWHQDQPYYNVSGRQKMRRGPGDFDPASDTIKVVTMKVSKGLEFPIVALAGVGHMPAAGEDEVDAARVFYVAATRATQRLVIGVSGDAKFGQRFG